MSFAHSLQGKCKEYMVAHWRLCSWFCTIAFASACVARQCHDHLDDRSTHALSLLQNHCSWQLGTHVGLPLYQEETILLFFTITAQELNFRQLERVAAMVADSIKYWSRFGRILLSLLTKFFISGSDMVLKCEMVNVKLNCHIEWSEIYNVINYILHSVQNKKLS